MRCGFSIYSFYIVVDVVYDSIKYMSAPSVTKYHVVDMHFLTMNELVLCNSYDKLSYFSIR